MKILFFYSRSFGHPTYCLKLTAYLGENINGFISFRRLEFLRLLVYTSSHQMVSFQHEYGKDNCVGHFAKDDNLLIQDMERQEFDLIDERNYLRFRKAALNIYQKAGTINFQTLETK